MKLIQQRHEVRNNMYSSKPLRRCSSAKSILNLIDIIIFIDTTVNVLQMKIFKKNVIFEMY